MTPVDYFDHLGRPIRLGQKIGIGGEGAVFEVVSSPDLVAKVYHKPLPARTEAKLRVMVGLARDELVQVAAWPTATLHSRPGGPLAGLVMRRIKDFKEIHTLYSPAHRKTTFPQADWNFLVTAAMNCAAAMETVHRCGVVLGDVNQSNVLVSVQGLIALIDCDSCQIQANGQTYPCDVGVPLFTPPELQGKTFRGLIRSPDHDCFGLAVLIFHLLFMGRHPFSGRFLGSGDMPIERAIAEHRFAYGHSAAAASMKPPLHSLPMAAVSPSLANLFERAFGRDSSHGSTRPDGRDWYNALNTFRQSLRACQVDPGHVYAPHVSSCPWCELMKQNAPNFFISVAYFKPGASQPGPVFVLATVWARIDQVPRPNPAYQRPAVPQGGRPVPLPSGLPTVVPPQPAPPPILTSPPAPPAIVVPAPSRQKVVVRANPVQWAVGIIAGVCGISSPPLLVLLTPLGAFAFISFVVFAIWWGVLEDRRRREQREANREYYEEVAHLEAAARRKLQQWREWLAAEQAVARRQYEERLRPWKQVTTALGEEATRRRQAKSEADRQLRATESKLVATVSRWAGDFDKRKHELRELRQNYERLAGEYAIELQRLQARGREIQREQYLQQQFISNATIDGIGQTRTATLASFGIETAWDVEKEAILQVPGFGPKLTERLLVWRKRVERGFVFNAAVGVPPHMRQALDLRYAQSRQQIESSLLAGEGELRGIAKPAEEELRSLQGHLAACLQAFAQSELDLTVIPQGA